MKRFPAFLSLVLSCVAAIAAIALAVDHLARDRQAAAQAVGEGQGRFILATAVSSNGTQSLLYLFDTRDEKLACYSGDKLGIEYRGTRQVTHDLRPVELIPKGRLSVEDVKKQLPPP